MSMLLIGTALAATADPAAAHDLLGLPWAHAAVGVAISLWGGATATLERYLAAKYVGTPFHTVVETAKDAMVSVSVGLVCYYTASDVSLLSPKAVGAAQMLAGYGGVRLLKLGVLRLGGQMKEGQQ